MADTTELWLEVKSFIEETLLEKREWGLLTDFLQTYLSSSNERAYSSFLLPTLTAQAVSHQLEYSVAPLNTSSILYYLATYLFDDLQDEGMTSVRLSGWSLSDKLNIGLQLLFLAQIAFTYQNCTPEQSLAIMQKWGQTGFLSADAQRQQPLQSQTISNYFRYTLQKSGAIFASMMWSGARIGTDDTLLWQKAWDLGMAIGVLRQISDDLNDLEQDILSMTHNQTHYTYPILYALNQKSHPLHPQLADTLKTHQPFSQIAPLLQEIGAVRHVWGMIVAYQTKAYQLLESFDPSKSFHLTQYVASFTPSFVLS